MADLDDKYLYLPKQYQAKHGGYDSCGCQDNRKCLRTMIAFAWLLIGTKTG